VARSVTTWQYNWKDQATNIVHKTSGGTVLASAYYQRAAGGEPTQITREDGSYVTLHYDPALRLTNEIFPHAAGVRDFRSEVCVTSVANCLMRIDGKRGPTKTGQRDDATVFENSVVQFAFLVMQ